MPAKSAEIMALEIQQQPEVCSRLLTREEPGLLKLVAKLRAKRPAGILLAARGSSDHAAVYGRYLLEHLTGIPTSLAAPSLVTLYKAKPRMKDYVVIGVSQSGQGPDINAVVKLASSQGAMTIGITNDPKSGLAKASRYLLNLGAEKEQAVAATKTFTAELAALALLGVLWNQDRELVRHLWNIPHQMKQVLHETRRPVEALAKKMRSLHACVVIGRGYQMGIAHEMGLKMKECAGVPALSYSIADFAHGPISLAKAGFPVFLLSAPGVLAQEAFDATLDLLRRGAKVVRVGLQDPNFAKHKPSPRLDLSLSSKQACPELLAPLLTILPGQWFAYYNALAKGMNPAMPKGLKKVTKTK